MAAIGPKRQFAAVQRYGSCRWNTGRSVDAADNAGPDPKLSSANVVKPDKFMLVPDDIGGPGRYARAARQSVTRMVDAGTIVADVPLASISRPWRPYETFASV
jgi:hypothetical protein